MVGIIDFERSVFEGDCLADPLKLLQIEHVFRKPDPESTYTYVSPLTDGQKLNLMEYFVVAREQVIGEMTDAILTILACRLTQQSYSEVEWRFLPDYLSDYLDQTAAALDDLRSPVNHAVYAESDSLIASRITF